MKKRLAHGMVLGLLMLGALVFGYDQGEKGQARVVEGQQKEDSQTADGQIDGTEQVSDKTPIKDLDEAYDVILNYCSREFIGSHPVDEAFLNWVYAQYGEEPVTKLADEVASGEQDVEAWYELTGSSIHVLWLLYCQYTGLQQYELNHVYWKTCASSEQTVLDFTGDINFSENWVTTNYMDEQPEGIYDCFSPDLLSEMNSADIMMINNEFTYSTRGAALEGKTYTFRADPKRVKLLEVFGTDIVSLANNHVYDFGEEALLDTLDTLEEAGVPYVGAGRNLAEAEEIIYFVANGRKIAIAAATQIERAAKYTREATEDSAGVLKTLNPDKFVRVIEEANENSDVVIAFVHWGTEGDKYYGQDQENLAKAFINAGADVIIGGHTHCLQGAAFIDGVPVIYSLGNFWFSGQTLDTALAQVVIEKNGRINVRLLPCIQKNLVTSLVTDETEKTRIFDYVLSISDNVKIADDGTITEELQ